MTSDAERTRESLHRIHWELENRLSRELATSTSLEVSSYDVLRELANARNQLTMTRLAERIGLSRSRASRIVDDLVAQEMLIRQIDPNDRRNKLPTLTRSGRARLDEVAPAYRSATKRAIALTVPGLSALDLAAIARSIEQDKG